jgi:CHAT domain-containing protein
MRKVLQIICWYLFSSMVLAKQPNSTDNLVIGKDLLREGQYFQAIKALELGIQEADTPEQKAYAIGTLGLTHYQLHHDPEAEKLLRQALALKKGSHREQARWDTLLGTIMLNQSKPDEAKRFFTEALKLAENDQELKAGIDLQQVEMLPLPERLPRLKDIQNRLLQNKPSEVRSSYLVRLATQGHPLGSEGRKLAYDSLIPAKSAAPPRLLAEILGELAQLYEEDHRYEEALQLNQDALAAIKSVEAPDLLLEVEWRQGRLHHMRQQIPEALADYQRTIEQIEKIRHDIPLTYRNGQSSFRTTLEPVYQQMADLLLEQTTRLPETEKTLQLRRVRNVIELVKQAELEDFLGGRCAIQPTRSALLEAIEPKTAIIYPIMLQDRLEILVSTGNEIQQFTQPVTAKELHDATQKFVGVLRSGQSVKEQSLPLYQWLVAPLEGYLQQRQVQTLVIVPDGILRLIPYAALYDGNGYLIERYALSISPGLSIIEPVPLHPHQVKSLVVGISEPGNVIDHIPETMVTNALGEAGIRGFSSMPTPRSRALSMPTVGDKTRSLNDHLGQTRNLQDESLRRRIKEALSLPGVVAEIDNLRPTIPGTVLLDKEFTVDRFRKEILNEPYAIVHIASHLITGPNSASSFIMAYDDVINFDQLDTLLRSSKFTNQPVEMLTLSACQTAEGDDRAPLGLSGLAIKAKVRSALGTLWPANDEAAPLLMVEFYKALNQPGTSKAKALQKAQLTLLNNKKLDHPFFWAPYILVGNWL